MLQISKLTDYALIILCEMNDNTYLSATFLSKKTNVPLATTNKILKLLNKSLICNSRFGKNGGSVLSRPSNLISLLDVIKSIDGKDTSIIECSNNENKCKLHEKCTISKKMNAIDKEIFKVLQNKFLSDII